VRKPIEEFDEWDYMYNALDLFTNKRKRCQIHLLRNQIFKIKEEFNKKYDVLKVDRRKVTEKIIEKNNAIIEIFEYLEKEPKLFEPIESPLNDPKVVLTVDGKKEIDFERYLTKAERDEIEA